MRTTILIEGRLIWIQPLTFKRNFNTQRKTTRRQKILNGGAQENLSVKKQYFYLFAKH